MLSRFLILVFAALPAVVEAQSFNWYWFAGPPAFVQPVAVGEVLPGLRLGYCQHGILRLTPATDGVLQVRVTWDQADGPFGVESVSNTTNTDYWNYEFFSGDTGSLIATPVVAAGRITEVAVKFERGWASGWDEVLWCDLPGGSPQPFTVEISMDEDGDGLPTSWETRFGLDPNSASGVNGATGDPDGDGKSNREELLADTHPRGLFTRYFAEGVTSDFFDLRFTFLNTGSAVTRALVQFRTTTGTTERHWLEVPPNAIRTLNPKTLPRMGRAEFSTVVESDQPLVADRTITWDVAGYGGDAGTSIAEPALRWYLAEGSTAAGFNLFYLLQNPNASAARVRVRYLQPTGAPPPDPDECFDCPGPWSDFATTPPLEKVYDLPPNSRSNIWVNDEDFPGRGKALAASDVSAAIEVIDGPPIVVERAMYLDTPGQVFGAGHESAGVVAPAAEWFLAEGATGPFFDLYVLVANPSDAAALVEATYLLPDGTEVKKPYTIAAGSRFNIHVDLEDAKLANTAVSTTVRSVNDVPIVVERAMWWPDGGWYEGHNSPGATTTGTAWALADGELGGAQGVETYILVANTSETTGAVKVTLLFEDGTSIDKTFAVTARSRFNVNVRDQFPAALNKRFGALVESQGPAPVQLVVERSMYWNATGQFWSAGTNALATRLQ